MKAGRISSLSIVCMGSLFAACMIARDKPPRHDGIMGAEFHYCPHCHSLNGGMYGKGPDSAKARINGANKESCRHDWQQVTKERFVQLAAEQHDRHLETESRYWASNLDSSPEPDQESN